MLFITVFVIVCIAATVALGNHLRGKIDPNSVTEDSTDDETDPPEKAPDSGISDSVVKRGSIRSGCIDICGTKDLDAIEASARAIFASGYDSVTIPLIDPGDGSLTYLSPAALALSRIPEHSELPKLEDVISVIKKAAAAQNILPTITAYLRLSVGEISDPILAEAALSFETALIAEAFSLGTDEVLISGFNVKNGIIAAPDEIISLLDKLRSMTPDIAAGIALPPSAYANKDMAQTLDEISAAADFLAVDTASLDWSYKHTADASSDSSGDDTNDGTDTDNTARRAGGIYDSLYEAASAIKGSVSLYGLSFTFEGEDLYLCREAQDALAACGIYGFYVTSCPIKLSDGKDDTKDPDAGTSPDEPDTTPVTTPDTKPKAETPLETDPVPDESSADTDPDTDPDTESDTDDGETTIDMEKYWEWYV